MSNIQLDKKIQLDPKIQELAQQKFMRIDAFDFQWGHSQIIKSDYLLRELKQLATIESVGSSTRIEGSELSDEERNVRHLVLLDDREYGEVGTCPLFWDKKTGLFNEMGV